MRIVVTGGAGYIGSHAVQRLLRDGHEVVALDNLFRGHRAPLELLESGAGGRLRFVHADIRDLAALVQAFRGADAVMHFAALAYVGESVDEPLKYYDWNLRGLGCVLEAIRARDVPTLVFSSSCSTYGDVRTDRVPVSEDHPLGPVSPYGFTKYAGEAMIRDFAQAMRREGRAFADVRLRYFNVCGCDRTGVLGEHHEPETHLIPVVLQAALGRREFIGIFGTDYPTPDGTCVRDYVHVEDLVDAHVRAMERLRPGESRAYNVGIGKGYSVREIIEATQRVTGVRVPVREMPRRAGDAASIYADPAKIRAELGWQAAVPGIEDIIGSAWSWFRAHPRGYHS